MKIKSKKLSRIVLITGYLLFFSVPFDYVIGIYSPFLISLFHPKWAPKDCRGVFDRTECRYHKPDPNCPPCKRDLNCFACLRGLFAVGTLKTSFFLAILSFLLLPYGNRTIRDYHIRLPLLVFSGAFGAWGYIGFAWSWAWAPILMLLRKFWFPIPADKTKATPSS